MKLECEKLAQEKTEIQRQYIMVKNIFLMQKKYHILIVAVFSVLRDVIWPERGNAQTGEENQGQVLVQYRNKLHLLTSAATSLTLFV